MSKKIDDRIKQAYEAGQHMRDAHKSKGSCPLYAMSNEGMALRWAWNAGWEKRDAEIRRKG